MVPIRRLFLPLILLLACCQTGCETARQVVSRRSAHPADYGRAALVYEAADPQLGRETTTLSLMESPLGESRWSAARLAVMYPHPDGNADIAQATLQLSPLTSPPASGVFPAVPDDELWVLDIPRSELDRVLGSLAQAAPPAPASDSTAASFNLRLDDLELKRTCGHNTIAEELMARVYQQGRLGGLIASAGP